MKRKYTIKRTPAHPHIGQIANEMISVIIPLYNAERYIQETLQSVQAQTYTDWECFVIDDGSTDGSATIVKTIAEQDARIHYVWQQNAGPSKARNHGLRLATGEYIQFLDADDYLMAERFERLLEAYKHCNEHTVLYSGLCLGAAGDIHQRMPYARKIDVGRIDFAKMYAGFGTQFAFIPGAILFPSRLINNIVWNETMRYSEDWDYYLQLTQTGVVFENVPQELFIYRAVENGLSQNTAWVRKANCEILARYYRKGLLMAFAMRVASIVYGLLLDKKHHRSVSWIRPTMTWVLWVSFLILPITLSLYAIRLRHHE